VVIAPDGSLPRAVIVRDDAALSDLDRVAEVNGGHHRVQRHQDHVVHLGVDLPRDVPPRASNLKS
jgi:hypothetical protein